MPMSDEAGREHAHAEREIVDAAKRLFTERADHQARGIERPVTATEVAAITGHDKLSVVQILTTAGERGVLRTRTESGELEVIGIPGDPTEENG
jgi:hypothetical protein